MIVVIMIELMMVRGMLRLGFLVLFVSSMFCWKLR